LNETVTGVEIQVVQELEQEAKNNSLQNQEQKADFATSSLAKNELYEDGVLLSDLYRLFNNFNDEFSVPINKALKHFWQKEFNIKLVSIENKPGLFWKGNNYFVSQANIQENADCFIRLSETICLLLFEVCFGKNNNPTFSLDSVTELEAELLSQFNNIVFEEIQSSFISKNEIKKLVQEEKLPGEILHLSFMVYRNDFKNLEAGKIIISIPKNIIKIKEIELNNEEIEISRFNKAKVDVDIFIGNSKISLEELKNLDCEDIVVLDKSNIHKMTILGDYKFDFKINPNPKLVTKINSDNEGGDEEVNGELATETNVWDNLQIEIGAEFKKVKLTLGELRQMSEGLIVDIANVYDNEITLTVENKPVAKGELIIIGDKYGVKLTQIVQSQKPPEEVQQETEDEDLLDDEYENEQTGKSKKHSNDEDDEDFDLSDFEIEDDDV
jgi:flagellar motor switch protein FliN/FliY